MSADRCRWPGCKLPADPKGRRYRDGRLCLGHTLESIDLDHEARS